jgi:hypothetical protein
VIRFVPLAAFASAQCSSVEGEKAEHWCPELGLRGAVPKVSKVGTLFLCAYVQVWLLFLFTFPKS